MIEKINKCQEETNLSYKRIPRNIRGRYSLLLLTSDLNACPSPPIGWVILSASLPK